MTDDQIMEIRKTLSKAVKKQECAQAQAIADRASHREHYHAGVARGLWHALMLLGGSVEVEESQA